jgi:hypothetical protein
MADTFVVFLDKRALLTLALAGALPFIGGLVLVPDLVWSALTSDADQPGAQALLAWREAIGGRLAVIRTHASPRPGPPQAGWAFDNPEFDRLKLDQPGFDLGAPGARTLVLAGDAAERDRLAADHGDYAAVLTAEDYLASLEAEQRILSAAPMLAAAAEAWRAGFGERWAEPLPQAVAEALAADIDEGLARRRFWIQR